MRGPCVVVHVVLAPVVLALLPSRREPRRPAACRHHRPLYGAQVNLFFCFKMEREYSVLFCCFGSKSKSQQSSESTSTRNAPHEPDTKRRANGARHYIRVTLPLLVRCWACTRGIIHLAQAPPAHQKHHHSNIRSPSVGCARSFACLHLHRVLLPGVRLCCCVWAFSYVWPCACPSVKQLSRVRLRMWRACDAHVWA